MTVQTQVSFTVPTTNTDGSAISEPLSFSVLIDTVNPPVKAYPVPAANVAAAVNGVVTVKFSDLGFVPVNNTDYFADAVATDADGSSAPSALVAFAYSVVPSAPTGFTVG